MSFIMKFLKKWGLKLRNTPLGRNELLGNLLGFITVLLHNSDYVKYGPFKIKFDRRDRSITKKLILYGEYEKREIELLCSHVKHGDTVLDIGANIGLYSLFLSRAVGLNGKVIAIEPDPENVEILKINLKNNKCKNVKVLQMALGSKTEEGDLFQIDTNRGNLSLADLNKTGRSIKVPINRGDEILRKLNIVPDVAKIDVEGAEPDIIKGLGFLKPPIIQFEFVPEFFLGLNRNPKRFLNSLVSEGYVLNLIDSNNGKLTRCNPSEIIAIAIGKADYNILARRVICFFIFIRFCFIDDILNIVFS